MRQAHRAAVYDAAILVLKANGCYGSKEYVARILSRPQEPARGRAFWESVEELLLGLNAHIRRVDLVAQLERQRRALVPDSARTPQRNQT